MVGLFTGAEVSEAAGGERGWEGVAQRRQEGRKSGGRRWGGLVCNSCTVPDHETCTQGPPGDNNSLPLRAKVWEGGRDDYLVHLAEAKCHLAWGTVLVRGEWRGSCECRGGGKAWQLACPSAACLPPVGVRVHSPCSSPPPSPTPAAPLLPSGIIANLLVCLAVWLANSARDAMGKIAGIYLPIMTFTAIGLEHCIANMCECRRRCCCRRRQRQRRSAPPAH